MFNFYVVEPEGFEEQSKIIVRKKSWKMRLIWLKKKIWVLVEKSKGNDVYWVKMDL